jgi:CO/xanthine dehydrogenase Mo-binding subunit
MGPGTYTSMTQVAAEVLGLPVERVRFELGDTDMPFAPVHGGSITMASIGTAVQAACQALLDDFAAVLRAGGARAWLLHDFPGSNPVFSLVLGAHQSAPVTLM